MQKSTQQLALRAWRATTSTQQLLSACSAVSSQQQQFISSSQLTNSLTMSSTMSFSAAPQKQTFEKIGNYESLTTKIMSSESLNDLLVVFDENTDIYKCEHLATTARMLARLSPKRGEIAITKDKSYLALTAQIQKNIKKFNESELMDLLFWARKFKQHRGQQDPLHMEIVDRVLEAVKRDAYELKNYGTIFFDVSSIGSRNSDEIVSRLTQKINADPSQLTTFVVMNILQTVTAKGTLCSGKELILVDVVCRYLPGLTSQLDIAQKALIFRQISEIEPFIHPPKYKMPSIMYSLKNELKEQVDSLSENSVLHLLNAYKQLIYTHFPTDLLEEIKEMVVVTVQHHSENIKSFFLLEFLDSLMVMNRKRRTDQAKLRILVNDLTKRVKDGDNVLLSGQRLDQLISYCDKYLKSNSSLISLLAAKSERIFQHLYNQQIVELLSKKGAREDFDRVIVEYFGKTTESMQEKVQQLSASNSRIGLIARLAVSLHPHRERHSELYEIVLKMTEDRLESDPLVVLVALRQCSVFNSLKKELLIKTVSKYIKSAASTDTDGQVVRGILSSVELKETRLMWSEYLKSKQIESAFITKFLEQYFSHEGNESFERQSVLLSILQISGENFPLRQIFALMKDNSNFLIEIAKHEIVFRRMLVQILEAAKRNPDHIKLINVYQICLRIESVGLRLDYFYKFMNQILEVQTASQNASSSDSLPIATTSYIGYLYQCKLAENGVLRAGAAKSAVLNKHMIDAQTKARFLALIAQYDAEYFTQNKEQYDATFKHLTNQLNSNSSSVALLSAAAILRLPSEYFLSESAFVMKSIKENLGNSNDPLVFTSLFQALPQSHGEFYSTLTRELIEHYIHFKRRIPFTEIRRIFQKMCELQIRDARVIASVLQDIESNLHAMTQEDYVSCLQSCCSLHVKQDEYIERNVKMFAEHPSKFRSQFYTIVDSLFKVGYTSDFVCDFISKSLRFSRFSYEEYALSLALVALIPSELEPATESSPTQRTSNPRQLALISEISSKLANPNSYFNQSSAYSHYTNGQLLALCTAYYSRFHADHPEILKFLEKYRGNSDKPTQQFIFNHSGYTAIYKYLIAMGIDAKQDEIIDSYEIPLSVPSTKQIVKVNSQTNLNFDKKTLDGKSTLEQIILESISGYEVITINLHEFYNSGTSKDQLSRINYLISKGIKCDPQNSYDLSKCTESASIQQLSEEQTIRRNSSGAILEQDISIADELLGGAEEEEVDVASATVASK